MATTMDPKLIDQIAMRFRCRVDASRFRVAAEDAVAAIFKGGKLHLVHHEWMKQHIGRTSMISSDCGRYTMLTEGVPLESPPPYTGGYLVRLYADETPAEKYYHRKEGSEILAEEEFADAAAAASALGGLERSVKHAANPYSMRNCFKTRNEYNKIPAGARVEVSRTHPPFQPLSVPVVFDVVEKTSIFGTWDATVAQWFLTIPGVGRLSAATCIARLVDRGRFDFVGDPDDEDVGVHLNYDTADDRITNISRIKKSELVKLSDRHWLRYYRQPGRKALMIRFSEGRPGFYFGSLHVFEELGLREEETVVGARTSDGRTIARIDYDKDDRIGATFGRKCTEIRAQQEAHWAKGGGVRKLR